MGVWKLSVFRPERKHDTGEFIPLEILVYQMVRIFNIFFNSFTVVDYHKDVNKVLMVESMTKTIKKMGV